MFVPSSKPHIPHSPSPISLSSLISLYGVFTL